MMVGLNNASVFLLIVAISIPTLSMAVDYSVEECLSKAEDGVAEAQWQLGQRYENGSGVKKNNIRAIAQYKKAAEQKHHKACAKLAELYENGQYVKRDAVLAAKYKAWASGDNGELAAAQVRTTVVKNQEDEIETALDYILGRNGTVKDPKAGIRILYQSAKDKPAAQKVFVDRWCRGDLDDALQVLSGDEWDKIIPWFKDAWDAGNKRTGLVLGNHAYWARQYSSALSYWQGSGLAKSWYFVGRFYAPWSEEGKGGGPASMRDETLTRKAYERCLRIDRSYDEAKFELGSLYLFASKKENENLSEAKRIFSYFLKKSPNDMLYNYNYGLAGFYHSRIQFDKKWPKRRVDYLLAWADGEPGTATQRDRQTLQEYNRMMDDWKAVERSREEYLSYIRKASSLGCEPAQKFMADYNSKHK